MDLEKRISKLEEQHCEDKKCMFFSKNEVEYLLDLFNDPSKAKLSTKISWECNFVGYIEQNKVLVLQNGINMHKIYVNEEMDVFLKNLPNRTSLVLSQYLVHQRQLKI